MLAGIISSPSAYSPRANPQDAAGAPKPGAAEDDGAGRHLRGGVRDATASRSSRRPRTSRSPRSDSLSPYFTSWLRQQMVDRYGAGKAFGGGLDVHTTIDLDMQEAAEQIAYNRLAGIEPTASVVVLDNETGAVKAMVGGNDYDEEPFNLATNGQRQPGSAFKPFVLAAYLENGRLGLATPSSPGEQDWIVPNSGGKEEFHVENYEDNYLGSAAVATATKYSDNSVFAEMGLGAPGAAATRSWAASGRAPRRSPSWPRTWASRPRSTRSRRSRSALPRSASRRWR